jgi:hypothetical protein
LSFSNLLWLISQDALLKLAAVVTEVKKTPGLEEDMLYETVDCCIKYMSEYYKQSSNATKALAKKGQAPVKKAMSSENCARLLR